MSPSRGTPSAQSWHTMLQTAAWICAALSVFILEPPGHSLSGGPVLSWTLLARFLVATCVGVILLIAIEFRDQRHLRAWFALAAAGLVAGMALLGFYGSMVLLWTCETADGVRLVMGTTLTAKAQRWAAGGHDTCADLLAGFATDPLRVWNRTEVLSREITLGWLFVAACTLLGVGLIALLQADRIVRNRRSRSTVSPP